MLLLYKIKSTFEGGKKSKMDKKNLSWEYSYMLGMTIIICILAALLNNFTLPVVIVAVLMDITVIIVLWTRALSRKLLYLLNVFNCLAAASLAYLIVTFILKTVDSFVAMIIVIIVVDVFSFTKKGKTTPNARLMNNTNTLARLCICLPVAGKPGLQPIIGVGDLYFYSTMLLFSLHIIGTYAFWKFSLLILAGQLANIILISAIRNKNWFKGFPATLFPGIFCITGILIFAFS
jgi:hypothetical protein